MLSEYFGALILQVKLVSDVPPQVQKKLRGCETKEPSLLEHVLPSGDIVCDTNSSLNVDSHVTPTNKCESTTQIFAWFSRRTSLTCMLSS